MCILIFGFGALHLTYTATVVETGIYSFVANVRNLSLFVISIERFVGTSTKYLKRKKQVPVYILLFIYYDICNSTIKTY